MISRITFSLALAVAASVCLSSCTTKKEVPAENPAVLSNNLVISAQGETMAFDKSELTVKAGETITVTMRNPSTTLKHNWVLTQPGKDNDVGIAGIKAGEAKGFIPDDPAIIAHTKLIESGKEDSVTFKAPPVGDYPYICTNAGHHTIMKGVLHSK